MSGTREGGLKARDSNYQRHGRDFYSNIGSKGGKFTGKKGFGGGILCNCGFLPEEHNYARCAGAKGGMKPRRGKKVESE